MTLPEPFDATRLPTRKTILLPTVYDTQGGSTRVLLAAADVLRGEHDVITRGPIPEADQRTAARFPSRPLVGLLRKLSALPGVVRLVLSETLALRRLRPHTIHVHDEPSLYVYGLAARLAVPWRRRATIVWHLHMKAGQGLAARLRVALADAAIVISNHDTPPEGLPVTLIRNPLGPYRPPAFAVDAKARLAGLGVVGTLDPRKGQDLAIRALARLRQMPGGEGACLTLVGPVLDEGYADRLRVLIADLGLTDAVVLAGSRRPENAFDGIGFALFPSRTENQPLAFAEALAGGLAIVASDIPAHRAMCEEAGADPGCLSPREPEAFAAAILAGAGRAVAPEIAQRVEALYAPERFADAIRAFHRAIG